MIQEKLEIADKIQAGVTHSAVAEKYNVDLHTLTRIKKGDHKLCKATDTLAIFLDMKTIRSAQFKRIDLQLLHIVRFCRLAHKPVTLVALSVRALGIQDKLLKTEPNDYVRRKLEPFCDTKNCCLAFTMRHALQSQSLQDKVCSVYNTVVAEEILQLCVNISEHPLDHIYNMLKTGLLYKRMPAVGTFLSRSDGAQCGYQGNKGDGHD